MSAKGQPVIIINKKKKHHGGHHGGAWKVAYADFVTAMMAFFLVMWLVGQSKAVKASVAGYFRDPGAFDTDGGRGVLPGVASSSEARPTPGPSAAETAALDNAVARIRARLEQLPELATLRKQIEFSVTPDGLRIDLLEGERSSFFDSGSAELRGETERILSVIARELSQLPDRVELEGHTDSRPYATSDRYSNWELSTDRANAARRVMLREGLRADQLAAIRGLADREPKVKTDPLDPRNRRVSILVKRSAAPQP